jgi:hypothetical protein
MKYLQNGGFQKQPLMRLTLSLSLLFITGFIVTNFLLYFNKMNLTPSSVVTYYNGSEEDFIPARSYQSMLEVSHGHLPMMALVLLLLTHLAIFAPFSQIGKVAFVVTAFLSTLLNEASSWLVRFVDPSFAYLKVASFVAMQGSLIFLTVVLCVFLWKWKSIREDTNGNGATGFTSNHSAPRMVELTASGDDHRGPKTEEVSVGVRRNDTLSR